MSTEAILPELTIRQHGDKGHSYWLGKKKLDGVTTVLKVLSKEGLIRWSANVEREMVFEGSYQVMLGLLENITEGVKRGAALDAVMPGRDAWNGMLHDAIGRQRAHEKKRDEARDIGKAIHELIEWHFGHQLYMSDDGPSVGERPTLLVTANAGTPERALQEKRAQQVEHAFAAFLKWSKEVAFAPIAHEVPVLSRALEVAGTADNLAYVGGRGCVVDWKSSKSLYFEHVLQIAAYWGLYNEQPRIRGLNKLQDAWIIQLPKDVEQPAEVKTHLFTSSMVDRYFREFIEVLGAYRVWKRWDDEHPWRAADKAKLAAVQ